MDRASIGSRIKYIRENEGITVRKLSSISGLTFQSISKIENGQYNTGIDNICKLCNALGYRIEINKVNNNDACR